jgi:hypothetical protein
MNAINDYFKQAELALAAYADLPTGAIDPNGLTTQAVGFSTAQANSFVQRWEVIEQYKGEDGRVVRQATGKGVRS